MNDIIDLAIAVAGKRGLVLIRTRDGARESKTRLIAGLILNGPLFVISGDEWLPAFVLPRLIRRRTARVREITGRLRAARASTCHRLFDSLAGIPPTGEPILVMDFLHTFYDAGIPLHTRLFRLRECCRELERLALHRPVIVTVREMEGEDYEKFIPALAPIADETFTLGPEHGRVRQPALF